MVFCSVTYRPAVAWQLTLVVFDKMRTGSYEMASASFALKQLADPQVTVM